MRCEHCQGYTSDPEVEALQRRVADLEAALGLADEFVLRTVDLPVVLCRQVTDGGWMLRTVDGRHFGGVRQLLDAAAEMGADPDALAVLRRALRSLT